MGQHERVLAAKPDNPSLIPGTHMVEKLPSASCLLV